MRALRWAEAVSGVLASVAGGAFLVRLHATNRVIASSAGCQGASQGPCVSVAGESITPMLVQTPSLPSAILLIAILAMLAAIACAAVWHSLTGRMAARRLLLGSVGGFVFLAAWAMIDLGIFLAPSMALALVASLCALGTRGQSVS